MIEHHQSDTASIGTFIRYYRTWVKKEQVFFEKG